MNIDTAKYWAYKIDDIDELQSDLNLMSEFSANAAKQLEVVIDTDVLANYAAGAATGNYGATAGVESGLINLGTSGAGNGVAVTGGESGTALDFILSCNQVLDEGNYLFV